MQDSFDHSLAIKSDGTLWAWGYGGSGQLGTGNTTQQNSPVQVGTATNWQHLSAGYNHSLAIRSDGTLWAWGFGGSGQLGTGNTTKQLSPVQIGSATNWQHVSAGKSYSLAIKSDGTLWAWGYGNFGQLGTGNIANQLSPIQIGTATNWQHLSAGSIHSLAIKSDGTLWAWGYGGSGQLGTGNTTQQNSPVQVGTATNWQNISAGDFHSLALSSVPLVCPPGDVTLATQAEVNQFIIDYPNCTQINGYLVIGNQVQNLNGLSNITTITGMLAAQNAISLTDVSGLSNLTSVGGNFQLVNTALTNLNGFGALNSVGGYFVIRDNAVLTNFDGFGALNSVGGFFDIADNAVLTNIDGFVALNSVGEYFYIADNAVLTNIDGFGALDSIGGYFYIAYNTALINLNAFSTLTSVGEDIEIRENTVLSDISALQNTTFNPANGYGLTILNNPALAVCNLPNFCAYLANDASTHPRNITGNLAECVNEQAVIDACNAPAAGCTNVTSAFPKWPTATYVPQCTGSQEDITGNYAETGEYSEIQVTAAVGYTFSSSVATDYITISNEDGTVVYAHGYSPLVWTASTNEIIRFFLHLDDACNTNNDPNNWRSRLIQCNSLSVSDINTNTISFYPNPVKETLYFSEEVSTIKITDLAGRTVKQYAVKSTSVNVSELSKGTYILSATTQEGKTFTKKIIKE